MLPSNIGYKSARIRGSNVTIIGLPDTFNQQLTTTSNVTECLVACRGSIDLAKKFDPNMPNEMFAETTSIMGTGRSPVRGTALSMSKTRVVGINKFYKVKKIKIKNDKIITP